ncbi:HNH endonuclease [Flavobacterium sp.]|uniref:HNH endonuclease n=1 Tax=Flavobacterium sp. TaxID=239 RepID=UPI002FDE21C6
MIPLQINNSFSDAHYLAVKDDVLHHLNRVLTAGKIKKNKVDVNLSPGLRAYLTTLNDETNNSLKNLINLSPNNLVDFVDDLNTTLSSFIDTNHDDNTILKNIFVSHGYEKGLKKWDFINRIKVNTCPYCNRNYIYTTSRNKKIKPEIDHFYPKSKYPQLALSYFNLIPSCKSCNGFGAKEENDPFVKNLKNPYLLNYNDFELSHKIKNIAIVNPLSGKSDIEVFFKNSIPGHLEVFNLKELYELHHDHAIELIIKRNLKYSQKYREYLSSYKGLKFSKSEIDRMILGNYALEKEQHKRPLSKLYQDIGKELGLI